MLLLIGYGLGRWQDTPAPADAAAGQPPPSAAAPSAEPSAAPTTTPPPEPTVYPRLEAESATELTGIQTQETEDAGGGQNVGWIASGDMMRFDRFDFGPVPATQLEVRVASDSGDGGRMEVRLDRPDGKPVGVLNVTRTGGWQSWRTDVVSLAPVTGEHTVFFAFGRPDGNEFVNINWLQFKH